MSIRQLPPPRWSIPGNSGAVASGYHVYFYQPGTSTPKDTYTDHTGTVANANPVVLDARGEANIWLDGTYKVIAYTGDKDNGGVLVWSQNNYGEGTSSVLQGNFNLCLNGSFEEDTNGDGEPDNWTVVEYTGGTVSLDTSEQIHGATSLKFASVGTGGGYATSDLFEVQGSRNVPVSFALYSSAVDVHNQVDIVWYTAAQAVISTTTLYNDSATNPASWTTYSYTATPPANARYAAIRLFGCHEDNATVGQVWFDNVLAEAVTAIAGFFPNVNANVTASDEELNYADGPNAANKFCLLGSDARVPFAQKVAFRGALVYKSSAQTIPATTYTAITFNAEEYDTDSIHDNATNNSRLTVPSGITRARLSGQCYWSTNVPNYECRLYINGSWAGNALVSTELLSGAQNMAFASPVLSVSAGDYFEFYVYTDSGIGADVDSAWFAIEIVE